MEALTGFFRPSRVASGRTELYRLICFKTSRVALVKAFVCKKRKRLCYLNWDRPLTLVPRKRVQMAMRV